MTIADRQQGWLSPSFHAGFRKILHQAATRYSIASPAYCLMPEHLHILAAGLALEADHLLWARSVRRSLNVLLTPLRLQKQGYDHVLRPSERGRDAFATLVHYISANPVRAELTTLAEDWPYTGACVSDLPNLDPRHSDYIVQWWTYWNSLR